MNAVLRQRKVRRQIFRMYGTMGNTEETYASQNPPEWQCCLPYQPRVCVRAKFALLTKWLNIVPTFGVCTLHSARSYKFGSASSERSVLSRDLCKYHLLENSYPRAVSECMVVQFTRRNFFFIICASGVSYTLVQCLPK